MEISNVAITEFLEKNGVLKLNEEGIFTEEFLSILNTKIEESDCIINHIPGMKVNASKVSTPVLSNIKLSTDDSTKIITIAEGTNISVKNGENKLIDLALEFSNSIFAMQKEKLMDYLASEISQVLIAAIHKRLSDTLIEAGIGVENEITYTKTWFSKFSSNHIKGNSIILISLIWLVKLMTLTGIMENLEY